MNILFFLTPKAACSCVYDDYSVRQAMERMEKTIRHCPSSAAMENTAARWQRAMFCGR